MTSPNEQNRPRSLLDCAIGIQAKPALARLQEGVERLQTGFKALDRALGGGVPVPTLGILGAKPKCGKSTLLLQMATHVVLEGGFVYLVDQENGLDRVLKRLMCSVSNTAPDDLNEGFVPTEPWKRAEALVLEGAYSKRLFVERERFFKVELVENRVRELKTLAGDRPCLVILDSLQKLPMTNLSDRRASIDGWMRGLENIRSRYSVVILVASELKRPTQGTSYKPSEVSLKESGDIEYSADLVLTLDRNENGDEYVTEKAPDAATMRILYNRDGQTGRVANYRLIYPYHRMEEEARPDFEGVRKAGWSGNVTPIRPGVEVSDQA